MRKSPDIPTKDRLLRSGALLFAEKGFAGVSVREICQHADTSMNMIHHYFGSKDGLLEAIVEQFSSHVFALPMRLLDTPPRSIDDFESRIEMLFDATLDAAIEHRILLMVVLRELADPGALADYMTRFRGFLEHAKKKGWVRNNLDSEMVTGFLLDRIINQIQFVPWIQKTYGKDILSDPKYRKRWWKSNLHLFLNGILA